MASVLSSILTQIVTQLATANGAGSYTYSLAGTDAVKLGECDPIAPLPQVQLVGVTDLNTEVGPTFRHYTRLPVVRFNAYVEAATTTELARGKAAADLLSDIMRTFESGRTLGGLVEDLWLENCAVIGAELERFPGLGICTGEIHLRYRVTAGC